MTGVWSRVVAGVVVLALPLAASCSTGGASPDPDDATPTPSASPSSSPPPTSTFVDRWDPRSRAELAAAVRALPRTIGFTYSLGHDDYGSYYRSEGTWRAPDRWSSVTDVRDLRTGEEYVMRTRSIGRDQWMQMEQWDGASRGCWLALSPTQVPVGILYMTAGRPATIDVLDVLRRSHTGYTVPYATALRLLPGRLVRSAGLARVDDPAVRVDVRVAFTGETIDELDLSGSDVLAAAPSGGPTTRAARQVARDLNVRIGVVAARAGRVAPPPAGTVFGGTQQGCRPNT